MEMLQWYVVSGTIKNYSMDLKSASNEQIFYVVWRPTKVQREGLDLIASRS